MRLGIMLRHFDQHEGGVKVYTREVVNAIDRSSTRKHEIVLLFRNRQRLGTYRGSMACRRCCWRAVRSCTGTRSRCRVPCANYGIDVLFNPKYSIPLQRGVQDGVGVSRHGLVRHAAGVALHRSTESSFSGAALCRQERTRSISVSDITREHLHEISECAARAHAHDLFRD